MSTSIPECARCGTPDPTRGYICLDCTSKVRRQVLQLADLAGDVQTTIARQARSAPPTAGGVSAELAEPANRAASDAAWASGNTVVVWMSEVAYLRGIGLPPPLGRPVGPLCARSARHGQDAPGGRCHRSCDDIRVGAVPHPIARAARWLADQLDWLRFREEADDALGELEYAAGTVRRAVDARSPRWYAGPCNGLTEGGIECTADLYGHVGADILRCNGCGSWVYAADRRAWLLERAEDVLGTAAQLAAAASSLGYEGVTSARIRGYAHRGRIVAHGVDEWARPTYRFGDVLDLLDAADTPKDRTQVRVA